MASATTIEAPNRRDFLFLTTGAVGAVGRIGQLSRERVRRRFEERFTARRMVQDYLEVYRSLMVSETPHLRVVSA